MKCFKDTIREARISKGIVLRVVAAAVGIDQTIINKFELGERSPSKEQLLKLAEFYDLDDRELIISWKSDLICYDLKDDHLAEEILKASSDKIKVIQNKL